MDNWYSDFLQTGSFRVRTPVGPRFTVPIQKDPVAHTASCKIGIGTFSSEYSTTVYCSLHTTSNAEVKERIELYISAALL